MNLQTVSDRMIVHRLREAFSAHGSTLRADSRRSPEPTLAARVLIRDYSHHVARGIVEEAGRSGAVRNAVDRTEGLRHDAVDALAHGLGLDEDARGWIRHSDMRLDSANWYTKGQLTDTGAVVRRIDVPNVLTDQIPAMAVEAWAEEKIIPILDKQGRLGVVRPGQTELPVIGVGLEDNTRKIHAFGAQTIMPWMAEIAANRASFSPLAEQAEAARVIHREFTEQLLAKGSNALSGGESIALGLDVIGFEQLGAPAYDLGDWSGSPTLTTGFAALNGLLNAAAASNRAVGGTSTLFIGTRLVRKIMGLSNFAAGGDTAGGALFAMLNQSTVIGNQLAAANINSVLPTPSLEGFRYGADYDGAVVLPNANPDAVRQLAALAPSPVYDYSGPHGRSTYWVQRHGGLGVGDISGVAVGTAKVA